MKYLPSRRELEENGRLIAAYPVGRHNEAEEADYWLGAMGRAYAVTQWWEDEDQDIIPISSRKVSSHQRGDIDIKDLGCAELIETPIFLGLVYSEEIGEALAILRDEGLVAAVEYCRSLWSDAEQDRQWFANWLVQISKRHPLQ